jgi:hypothetical protein
MIGGIPLSYARLARFAYDNVVVSPALHTRRTDSLRPGAWADSAARCCRNTIMPPRKRTSALPFLAKTLPQAPPLSLQFFSIQLIEINRVEVYPDERPLFEQFLKQLELRMPYPVDNEDGGT